MQIGSKIDRPVVTEQAAPKRPNDPGWSKSTFVSSVGPIEMSTNAVRGLMGMIHDGKSPGSVFARPVKRSLSDVAKLGNESAGKIVAAKQKIYDDFMKDGTFNMPSGLNKNERARVKKYLRDNTFHFLGRAVDEGKFDTAKKLIEANGFNGVSDRLLDLIQNGRLTPTQKDELLALLVKKSPDITNASKAIRTLIKRGQIGLAKAAVAYKFSKTALRVQTGDVDGLREFNFKNSHIELPPGETLLHLAVESGNAEMIKLVVDQLGLKAKDFLKGTKANKADTPISRMSLETARELDRLSGKDANGKDSYSNQVMHAKMIQRPISGKKVLAGAIPGKIAGDSASYYALPILEHAGGGAATDVGTTLIMYGIAALGGLAAKFFNTKQSKMMSEDLGVTGTKTNAARNWFLNAKGSKQPELNLDTIRALEAIPDISGEQLKTKLNALFAKKPENKDEAGNALLERLLEVALQKDPKATADFITDALQKGRSIGTLRTFMVAAVRMGDVNLMQAIEQKWTADHTNHNLADLYLDTMVHRNDGESIMEDSVAGKGSRLSHVAIASRNANTTVHVLKKMNDALKLRKQSEDALDLSSGLFGVPAWKMLDGDFAHELDEKLGTTDKESSLSNRIHTYKKLEGRKHGVEFFAAGAAKTGLNVTLMAKVAALSMAAGSPAAGIFIMFTLGTALAAGGAGIGYMIGNGFVQQVNKMMGLIPPKELKPTLKSVDSQLSTMYKAIVENMKGLQNKAELLSILSKPAELTADGLREKFNAFIQAVPEKDRGQFTVKLSEELDKISSTTPSPAAVAV